MSSRATVVLALVLAALAAAYWQTGRMKNAADRRAQLADRLFDFEADAVTTLSIDRAIDGAVEAMRETGGAWKLLTPLEFVPANQVVWGRMARELAGLKKERVIEESPQDLNYYELHEPLLQLIAGTNTNTIVQLRIGAMEPTDRFRYAQVGDGPVVLIDQKSFLEMDRPLLDLRERHIIQTGEEGLTGLDFVRVYTGPPEGKEPGPNDPAIGDESVRVSIRKGDDGLWWMREPVDTPANQEKVQALITEMQFMAGQAYIDQPEAISDYGLEPPQAKITMYGAADGKPRTLSLGSAGQADDAGGIYARIDGEPSVSIVSANVLTLLPDTPDAFRDARVFAQQASDLTKIRLDGAGGGWTLTYAADAGWRLTDPPADDTDQNEVSRYISFLKGLSGVTFPTERPNFDAPFVALSLTTRDGNEYRIAVGEPISETNPMLFYTFTTQEFVTSLPLSAVTALRADPFQFRRKQLVPFKEEAAKEIALEFEGTKYRFVKRIDAWAVYEPEDMKFETQSDATAIVEALAKTRALSVANPPPARDVQGVDTPVLSATITLETGPGAPPMSLGPLAVGALKASESRERFAVLAGRDEVFFVDQSIIDDIRTGLAGIVPTN